MQDQLTVRLPEDLSRALKAASRRLQRKSSEIVRLALREFLGASSGHHWHLRPELQGGRRPGAPFGCVRRQV